MKFIWRIFGFFFGRKVQNRLESGYMQWGARRWQQTTFQDARFEFDFAAVRETCRKHLDLIENTPLLQKIRNLKLQFAVGVGGLKVIPNPSDPLMLPKDLENWAEVRGQRWEQWCKSPELGSNLSMAELTLLWEGSLFDVGNVLIHKTRDELGRPKIQTIDFGRLQTPPRLASEEHKTIEQGVRLTTIKTRVRIDGKIVERDTVIGKPYSYFIRESMNSGDFVEIPANEIIHKFRTIRPGMMVGLPEAFSVINTVIDYTDLHILEMGASKLAGEIANVMKTPSGEMDTLQARRAGMKLQTQPLTGNPVNKSYGEYYDVSVGSKMVSIPTGSDLKNFIVERPTVAQQNYWDLKISEICAGYNVPKLLVFPFSLQGTVTRADLDVCANAFRSDFEIIASILREIYEWQSAWAVKYDRGQDGKTPADPLGCVIRPPRAPNVDIGYTAERIVLELENGITTMQDVYADKNEDWRIQTRQIFEYLDFVNQLCKEFPGVKASQVTKLMAEDAAAPAKPDTKQENITAGATT